MELDGSWPKVLCDERQIIQVLVNLIGNAQKFSPQGGLVTVRAGLQDDVMTVEVEDNGPGIRYEDQEKIFHKFTQINRAHGPGIKGTGLGLAITKKIVELHGGKIYVKSEPEQGSTFTFTLPVYERDRELWAFIKDCSEVPGASNRDWCLVLVKMKQNGEGVSVEFLKKAKEIIDGTLRQGDEATLFENKSMLGIMVQSDEKGGIVALQRLFPALSQGLEPTVEIAYAMIQDAKEDTWKKALNAEFHELKPIKEPVLSKH
jgi:hypothetical protein